MNQIGFLKSKEKKESNCSTIVPIEYTHSCAIGQTGCGKTTSYIYPNISNRIKENHGVLVFDYKGKEHIATKLLSKKNKRLIEVVEIGKDWGKSINIIKYMNEASLENFLHSLFGLNGTENEYWGRSATNISMSVLKVLEKIEQLLEKAFNLEISTKLKSIILEFNSYSYPTEKTLYSLSKVVKSAESLKSFIRGLNPLHTHIISFIREEIKKDLSTLSKKKIKNKYHEFFYELQRFKECIDSVVKDLNSFNDTSSQNSRTIQTILLSINTPLMNIANIKWLNDDRFDIVKSLNSGSIIILNTKLFSDNVLSSYSNALLTELSKRTSITNKKPISIFIDEAQRIMSNKFDLPIDILREAEVELFLAFQNEELLIEKIGNNKYSSLIKNIKNQYIYKNIGFYEDNDLSKLETFEYYTNEKIIKLNKASSIFMNKKESFFVELEYQKIIDLHSLYNLKKEDKEKVILYDEMLIKEGFISLIDIDDKIYKRLYFEEELSNKANNSIDEILEDIDYDSGDIDDILEKFDKRLSELKAS